MSVRKYAGKRGTRWHCVIELGRDPATSRRRQHVITRDPDTGLPILTKTRAKEIERDALIKHRTGRTVPTEKSTVAEYLERWLRETEDTRAESTHYQWASVIKVRIVPNLGPIPLHQLTPLHIQGVLREQGKRYAPGSNAHTRMILSAALRQAVRWGLIDSNPAADVRLPKGTPRPAKPIWSVEEMRAFLAFVEGDASRPDGIRSNIIPSSRVAVGSDRPESTGGAFPSTRGSSLPHAALWRFLYDSGVRIAEALALSWTDVDLTTGEVRISKGVALVKGGKRAIVPRTKTGRSRTLFVNAETLRALRRHATAQKERRLRLGEQWRDAGLIFDRGDGARLSDRMAATYLARDIAAAGLPPVTLHAFRHCMATHMAAAGIPLHVIQARLGHSKLAMTSDLYTQPDKDADRRASDALAKTMEA